MFVFKDSKDIPGPKKPIQIGYPDCMEPDICIVDTNNIYAYLELNSKILREALIANPQFALWTLGLKIEDRGLGGNKK